MIEVHTVAAKCLNPARQSKVRRYDNGVGAEGGQSSIRKSECGELVAVD
jgi:hypothetical protein